MHGCGRTDSFLTGQWVRNGKTSAGLVDVSAVVEASFMVKPRKTWLKAELDAVGLTRWPPPPLFAPGVPGGERLKWSKVMDDYEGSGMLDGRRVHAREVAAVVLQKTNELSAADADREARREAKRARRAAQPITWTADPATRQCTATRNGERCANRHKDGWSRVPGVRAALLRGKWAREEVVCMTCEGETAAVCAQRKFGAAPTRRAYT
jgi:hypothetical protein